jgi:integrase
MGRTGGGVKAHGGGIQINLRINGKRIRPTLDLKPTPANLKYAERIAEEIRAKQRHGTLDLADYFPGYRHLPAAGKVPLFREMAATYLATTQGELAHATRESYRKILTHFWYQKIGDKRIDEISYSDLKTIIAAEAWQSNKTRNNIVSVGRRVFEFAYLDEKIETNPAERLKSLKVQRGQPDPYTLDDALRVIEGHRKYGDAAADYAEMTFFEGLRPSEQIALMWEQVDLNAMQIRIDRARVMGKDKNTTKTSEARTLTLSPRGAAIIKRMEAISRLARGAVFLNPSTGKAYHDEQIQRKRWRAVHEAQGIRYREPYQARHTSVSWRLMIGENLLKVAAHHGHSPAVMLKVYAKWIEGQGSEVEIERLSREFGRKAGTSLEQSA